jgi:hypothetical protein
VRLFTTQPCAARTPAALGLLTVFLATAAATTARADPVAVRHSEGLIHGFLVLRTLDGTTIGDGDLVQVAAGNQVTLRLTFHFKDGSLQDETTVYTQRKQFRLVSDHLVQKGPAFKTQIDASIDARSGRVQVRSREGDDQEKTHDERLKLPPDVANGLILTLLKNIPPDAPKTTLSMVAITPKPRLVKLELTPAGEGAFATGGMHRKAMHFVAKVDIPGLAGAVASLLDKTPPDSHIWILEGDGPAFVKSESPFFPGAPLWRIELVSPTWP